MFLWGVAAFAERFNSHELLCFFSLVSFSSCIPCGGGDAGCPSACAYVCTILAARACLWMAFVIWLGRCACPWFWFALLLYLCACVLHIRVCVLLCGCLSLVSIFIFRKCCRSWQQSIASCRPTPSCTRASSPNRRSTLERRLLVCRYRFQMFVFIVSHWQRGDGSPLPSYHVIKVLELCSTQLSWWRRLHRVTTSTWA